jgi:hypothetical protein
VTAYTKTCTETPTISATSTATWIIDYVYHWVAMLNSGWATATGSTKPTISRVIDYKRFDLASTDYVFVYPVSFTKAPVGVGYDSRRLEAKLSVDIRTAKSGSRLLQIAQEVDRIVMANRINKAVTGFQVADGPSRQDLSDKMRLLYRIVLDYRGFVYNEPIS